MKQENKLILETYFSTPIYTINKPEFLDSVKKVSKKKLKAVKKEIGFNKDHPVIMTDSFFDHPKLEEFSSFIAQTSWGILSSQGYDVDNMGITFSEMWTQEHHRGSYMEQHTHRFGSQIVGFYFLSTPSDAPRVVFYDPRQGAVQAKLPESDLTKLSLASSLVNFEPKAGLFIFTNSWLAHSFNKNISDKPFRFVHFNLTTTPLEKNKQTKEELEVEII